MNRFEVFIIGIGLVLLGIYTIVTKTILQDMDIVDWDVSDQPYIAYIMGIFFFAYGLYILAYWIKMPYKKDKRTAKERLKNMIPNLNLFHIVMFLLISFPVWFFIYALFVS